MKNSLYAAFERMWYHIQNRLVGLATETYVDDKIASLEDEDFYTQPTAPAEAVDGDFWIDTSVDTYAQKKIYESPTEPQDSQDGDMWIDTSDMV